MQKRNCDPKLPLEARVREEQTPADWMGMEKASNIRRPPQRKPRCPPSKKETTGKIKLGEQEKQDAPREAQREMSSVPEPVCLFSSTTK